jgi:hypothetical protein
VRKALVLGMTDSLNRLFAEKSVAIGAVRRHGMGLVFAGSRGCAGP